MKKVVRSQKRQIHQPKREAGKRSINIGYCKTVEQVQERLAIFGLVRNGD